MEVTRSNFAEVLESLQSVIRDSSFVAFDGEFTGLVKGQDVKAFDSPCEYYKKIRHGSMDFLFVQFGLSAFKFNSTENKWTHTTYNFYIFPRPYKRFVEDPRFICQSSSIDFLASHGFDFNKVFKEGISYLTQAEMEKQRNILKDRHSRTQNGSTPGRTNPVPIPEEYEALISKTCSQIKEFIASDLVELELNRSGAFIRKLLYQTVEEKFAGVARLETRETSDGSRVLFVIREGNERDRIERELEKQQKELQELDDAFGFSKVISLLRESEKLLIGHNVMLDICHMLNRFCSPLPEEYSDFKDMANCAFPRLVDTKYLASGTPFKQFLNSTTLSDLYQRLSEDPFQMPVVESSIEECSYSSTSQKYHEAGYDAYITGMCFLTLAKYLDNKSLHPDVSLLPLLKPYLNKITLVRIQDLTHINLKGADQNPPRDHVFHVSFPNDWKTGDITKLFSTFGSVYISWIDDGSAYVALYQREHSSSVMKVLGLSSSSKYRIVPFLKYQQLLQGPRVPSSPTTAKFRRRSQEKLLEADAPADQGANRKRKSTGPARESKFSRRSIDTIVEEDDSNNAAAGEISSTEVNLRFGEDTAWE